MGGGVGSVLRSYLQYETSSGLHEHQLIALETLNAQSKDLLSNLGIAFFEGIYHDKRKLNDLVSESDVLLLHWWNHPLLQDLLLNFEIPENRMVIWCHISGSESPNVICDYILDLPDRFIFTTPLSKFTPSVASNFSRAGKQLTYIWSTMGFESIESQFIENSNKGDQVIKKIGYVGNLDETKVHSRFFDIFSKVKQSYFSLEIIGPQTSFFDSLSDSSVFRKFTNYGYVTESEKFEIMRGLDVFAYPLARHHYGTCDQSIQEAMMFGLPTVVFNNPMESFMIQNGVNGLIARNETEFVTHIESLLTDHSLRTRLGNNAHQYAINHFSIKEMSNKWNLVFQDLNSSPKNVKAPLSKILKKPLLPSEVMAISLGIHGQLFQDYLTTESKETMRIISAQISCLGGIPSWRSPTKSSVNHYCTFFDDETLHFWKSLIFCADAKI